MKASAVIILNINNIQAQWKLIYVFTENVFIQLMLSLLGWPILFTIAGPTEQTHLLNA
jgi:hypothetical protein